MAGAGLSALAAVAALRTSGYTAHVTVLGAEGLAPYDRPPLSKHLLDRAEPAWLSAELGLDLHALADVVRLSSPATGLRLNAAGPHRYTVTTVEEYLPADAVVIATGAIPRRPAGWASGLTLHTASDADALRVRLRRAGERGRAPRVVCVGAGWIGAEVAGVLARAGARVTVVEATEHPLGGQLGPEVGRLMASWYREAGVELLLGTRVAEVSDDGVRLVDGTLLEADAALVATGARPATDWLKGSVAGIVPLLSDGSIPVDGHGRLLTPAGRPAPELAGVRAVGDCTQRHSPRHGLVPGGHWNAALHAPRAAMASLMPLLSHASDPDPSPGVSNDLAPSVFSTQFGRELLLVGQPGPGDEVVIRRDGAEPGWSAIWLRPDTEETPPGSPAAEAGAAPAGSPGGPPALSAVLTVDRPREAAAARRLFTGTTLPRMDPSAVADAGRPLRDALA